MALPSAQMQAELADVSLQAECLFDLASIATALDSMANQLNSQFVDKYPLVLAVMNGGLVAAGQLLPRLSFPLTLDYVHATRYRDTLSGGGINWLAKPATDMTGRHILLVDDIFDEGVTLKAIVDFCRNSGAASVTTAVLCEKLHARKVANFSIDYAAVSVPDRYVFGLGMDYKGFYRNAPGIFALAD